MSQTREANYKGVFDGRIGFGERPCVLVIDFIKAYTTKTAAFFGQGVVDAVDATVDLLAAAREVRVPIIYTKVLYHPSGMDGGLQEGAGVAEVRGRRAAHRDRSTHLAGPRGPCHRQELSELLLWHDARRSTLSGLGVDTLILTGCSTSGCVRAAAIDGIQYGYRVIVPRECVGDRHEAPHDANLFDINAKYGDVVAKKEVMTFLAGLANRVA